MNREEILDVYFDLMWRSIARFSDTNPKVIKEKINMTIFEIFIMAKIKLKENILGNILCNIKKTINIYRKASQVPEKKR